MAGALLKLQVRDAQALRFVVCRRHRVLDPVMRAVTHLGDAAVTVGIVVVLLNGNAALVAAGQVALAGLLSR